MTRKTTISILAIAITTTACSGAIESPQPTEREALARELASTTLADALARREHFMPLCDANGYPLPGNINAKGGTGTTVQQFCDAIKQMPAPKPDPKPACDFNGLNSELSNTLLDDAVTNHAHFRCLCDDQGYPLVGNINAKGATASQFCGALREKGLL